MATSALSPQGSRAEVTAAQAHDAEEEDEGEEYVPLKTRRERHQEQMRKKLKTITAVAGRPETLADDQAAAKEEEQDPDPEVVRLPKISPKVLHVKKTLLATSHKLRAEAELHKKDEEEELREEEEKLLEQVSKSINAPLQSVKERAKGIVYTGRMQTSWELPEKYQRMTDDEATAVRDKFFIDVNGVEVPPPAKSFRVMPLATCFSISRPPPSTLTASREYAAAPPAKFTRPQAQTSARSHGDAPPKRCGRKIQMGTRRPNAETLTDAGLTNRRAERKRQTNQTGPLGKIGTVVEVVVVVE
eukprot:GHVT01028299.1.p1 GENE.GHVT01028299.1~~GHVT01028299.1.p1  ORF type:complete len:302 (-),score=77.88 GHVT01028299.1:91-996(-)